MNQDFLIRKMTGRDLDEIMQIELQSFTLPWSRQSYENELNNRYATYIVADYEGEVAAYGGIWVVFEEAHITNVAVAPRYRRQGMGSRLLQACSILPGKTGLPGLFGGEGFQPCSDTIIQRWGLSHRGAQAVLFGQ